MRVSALLLVMACFALPCNALLPAVPLLNTASILPGVTSDDLQLSSNSPPAVSYHKVVIGSGNAALGFVIAEERALRKAARRHKLARLSFACATVLSLASLGY